MATFGQNTGRARQLQNLGRRAPNVVYRAE
jgi:hypothetical protein